MKIELVQDGKKLATLVSAIIKSHASQKDRISLASASIILHAMQHGDVTLATKLTEGLEGWRVNTLREWFIKFGPMVWNAEKKAFSFNKEKAERLMVEYNRDKAAFGTRLTALPFWKWKPEPQFDGFDLDKALAALLTKANKIANDPTKSNHEKNNFTHMAALAEFIGSLDAKGEGVAVN